MIPLTTTDGVGGEEAFYPILNIPDSQSPVSDADYCRNMAKRIAMPYPRLHLMPGYGKYKGTERLAIVAGGPSLNETLAELDVMPTIMACGSAHDRIVELGYVPDYTVVSDPHPAAARYLTNPVKSCKYLISSACDDAVFDALDGFDVILWNSAGVGLEHYQGEPCIQGGGTVTLRATNLAIVLGHLNHHYFGFDSSFKDEQQTHAYAYDEPEKIIRVRVGGVNGREFLTNASGMVQALHWQEQLRHTGYMFTPTVHGDGMIAEIMRQGHNMEMAQSAHAEREIS